MVLHVARAFHVVGLEGAALELVEDGAVGLGHHVAEHVKPARCGHADHDFLDAELAAALDDLLQRRDHGLGAVQAEALGAGVFDIGELLENLGLDQLVEDRPLALGRERDVLVAALDALLDPRLLRRVGDVHELDADVPAIGAAQDLDDLADGGRLQPQHLVDEDRPVEISVGEAVEIGAQLPMLLALGDPQRVQIGGQVAHGTVGADQHERADAVLGGAQGGDGAQIDAAGGCPRVNTCAQVLLGGAVVAGQRRQQLPIALAVDLLEWLGPRRSLMAPHCAVVAPLLLQAGEEVSPLVAHRPRVALVLRLHLLYVGGVGTLQKGGAGKGFVLGLACHL